MANTSVCLTPACIHASSRILSYMAPQWEQMDPCTEFAHMTCYGFQELNGDDTSSFDLLGNRDFEILRALVEAPYPQAMNYTAVQARDMLNSTSADEQNFEMLQTLYQSCMEEETVSEAGTGPLIDLVMSLGVFWPVDLNDSTTLMNDSDSTSFATAITYLTTLEIPAFANLAIDEDLVYPDIATVSVGPNYNQTAYNVTQIASVLQSIGNSTGISDDVAEALAEGIADLQDALYTVAPDSSLDFPPFEAMNITEIADLIPNLGLAETIVTLSPDGYTADRILVKWPEYWGNVSSIVQSTPKSILYAWLAYQIVLGYGPYVQTSADDPTGSPRWKTCVESLSGLFYIGSRFWISAAFSQEAREVGDEMLLKIRSQFKTRIGQLTWMSDEVKALSMEKVDNVEQFIGYPNSSPDIEDPDAVAAYYVNANITDDYFANMVSLNKVNSQNSWTQLARPWDKGVFDSQSIPYFANANYSPLGNTIRILAGIMRSPFFSTGLPAYATYGALGMVLGHELTHGFDTNGRLFNQNGSYQTWWDNNTIANFEQKAQCLVDQYSNYTVSIPGNDTYHINGTLTVGENLADAGGINTAYDAWKNMSAMAADSRLPGLDMFTADQLFFISFSNLWCSSYTPEKTESIIDDVHSPGMIRIQGAVANSRAFGKVWNCPVQEPVCDLW